MVVSATALTQVELASAIIRDPLIVAPDTRVMTAIAQMNGIQLLHPTSRATNLQSENHRILAGYNCVLVVEKDQFIGILTEREIIQLIAQKQSLETLLVCEVMNADIVTLRESQFTDPFFAIHLFQQHQIGHLPLLDEQQRLVGLLTQESLNSVFHSDLLQLCTVADVMISEVVYATPAATLLDIAQLMSNHSTRFVAIVPSQSELQPEPWQTAIGLITEREIVRCQALGFKLETCVAQAIMRQPIVVQPTDSLWVAQQLLSQHRFQPLIVTGSPSQLGVITQGTLLQALTPQALYQLAQGLGQRVLQLETESARTPAPFFPAQSEAQEAQAREDVGIKGDSSPRPVDPDLQACENRFRELFNSNVIGMICADLAGGIVDANDRFLGIVGYSREELEAGAVRWDQMTPPEYIPSDLAVLEQLRLHGVQDTWEKEYYRKDGSRVPVLIGATMLPGMPQAAICFVIDISDRKQAELALQVKTEELNRFFSLALDLLCIANSEGYFVRLNHQWSKVLGYPLSELEGSRFLDYVHPDDLESTLQAVAQRKLGQSVMGFANRYRCHDGSYRWLEWYAVPYGSLVYATARDITERIQAEQENHQQAERERLLREITQRIRQSLDLQSIFETACQEIRQVLQADRVAIFKFYPESKYDDGEFVAESVVDGFISVIAVRVHDHCFGENYATAYAQGRCFAADDIYCYGLKDCHTSILADFQVRANLVLPLLCGNDLWGLLCIHQCHEPRHWLQAEIGLGYQLANQLALAIQQALLYEQVQSELQVRQQAEARIADQLRQQKTLGTIVQQIRQSLELTDILSTVTQQVKELLQGDRVIIFRLFADGRSEIVEEAVSDGLPSLKALYWEDEVWSQDILNWYWQGNPRIVADVFADTWTDCLVEYSQQGQIKSKIVAPILQDLQEDEEHRWVIPEGKNKLWGILVVHSCHEQRIWQESEAQLLQQVANQLAIAIQQSVLFGQLQQELAERQQAEEQLIQSNYELAHSNQKLARATRLKDEFLANMSHELRTPLNAILGMTEGLQEEIFGCINERQKQALQTVETSGLHLLSLIDDILDVAKIESGQIELESTSVVIETLCASSLAFIKQQALKKNIQLETQFSGQLPNLWVDERRIRQVLINLLTNAVKFTPEGGKITLTVSLLNTQHPPNFLRITVTDTGIGIAPENILKLFRPFVQIDSALNRQYTGTGLGLALVKQIVELHGGQVGLTSELGVGSCFSIDLPCDPAAIPAPRHKMIENKGQESFAEQSKFAQSPLILVAEDNEDNVKTISAYLEAKGYRLLLAKNGQEAIDLTQSKHPDLILMDIQMPGIDGLETMRRLRSNTTLSQIPIIALTALAMMGDREQCLAAGASDYLTKPIKLKHLADKLAQFLQR